MIRFLEYAASFVLLIILQEFVFDHINLGGLVNPYVYIMFIMLLPLQMRGWALLLAGFGMGAVLDVMSGTSGIQMVCATWLAFVRPGMVSLMLGKDSVHDGGIPTAAKVGQGRFIRYVVMMTLLFNIPFFLLEDIYAPALILVLRIVLSTLFTAVIIYFLHLPLMRSK